MSLSPVSGITELDNFLGPTAGGVGTRGQVPAPAIGDETKFLRGDGTWANGGSSGGGNGVQATVDFGFATGQQGDIATVTVAATWVTASSVITASPYAVATADHDPEDYAVEGITAYAANLSVGVGFDIIAAAPNGTWGRYVINAMGV